MRVIAGRYGGRRLKARPPGGTRPTSDKLRETLFNILGARVIESSFLDGYAGVGAIGIEALSRGARRAVFVDRSPKACAAIAVNLDALEAADCGRVLRMDLARALDGRLDRRFDIAFLDPPYAREDLYLRDIERFGAGSFLDPGGVLVIEHGRAMEAPAGVAGLDRVRTHVQGDSALTFYEQGRR